MFYYHVNSHNTKSITLFDFYADQENTELYQTQPTPPYFNQGQAQGIVIGRAARALQEGASPPLPVHSTHALPGVVAPARWLNPATAGGPPKGGTCSAERAELRVAALQLCVPARMGLAQRTGHYEGATVIPHPVGRTRKNFTKSHLWGELLGERPPYPRAAAQPECF